MIKESTPTLLTAPAKLPVSLNEFMLHARVDADDDAAIINTYLAAATGRVDGWNGILGAALITQVWQADFDQFPGSRRINLPIGPVQSVVVKYSDADNVEQTFAGANYSAHEDAKGDYLWLDTGQSSWPGTYDREDAVRIEITAGYGDDPSDVPEAIRLAIIHTAAHWFTHREPVVDGRTMGEVPMMADAILENYRRYSFQVQWYPDWSGEVCAILASGPSASREQAAAVRNCRLIVVNCAWRLAPWADVLYACDGKWWRSAEVGYGQSALRKFHGLKITNDEPVSQEFDVRHIKIQHESRFIMEPGVIGNGLNGGFQALNLALHFGARRIMLLGYDMHADNGLHFHKDHPQKMGNPQPATFRRYMGSFNDAMASLKEAGAEVVNCTPGSAMNLFPKMTTREALDLWGIDAGRNPCPTAAAISRRPDGECARGPGL